MVYNNIMSNKPYSKPKVYHNVLSEDQRRTMIDLVEAGLAAGNAWEMDSTSMSRWDVNIDLPEDVQNIFDEIAKDFWNFDEKHINHYIKTTAIIYKTNNPMGAYSALHPHADTSTCGIILDYQLASNIDWPLGVDDNLFYLEDNDLLYLHANIDWHWRPKKYFRPSDYQIQLLVQYETGTLYQEKPELLDIQNDESMREITNEFFDKYTKIQEEKDGI